MYDGHQNIATTLQQAVSAEPNNSPSERLYNVMLAGLDHELERKDRPPHVGIGNNFHHFGPGLGKKNNKDKCNKLGIHYWLMF